MPSEFYTPFRVKALVEVILDMPPGFARRVLEAKRGPTMAKLKRGKVALTAKERKQVMDAGAVWHYSHQDKPTPAVWKSVVNGKTWYCCNTHRAGVCKPTLRGAISAYKWVETTA